jgi:thiol-disulfide isomerase/thioredoxin
VTSSMGKRRFSTAFIVLLLLIIPTAGEGQFSPQAQQHSNITTPTQVFPDAPVVVNDDGLKEALRIYSPFVLDCWELGCSPCQSMDSKIDRMAASYRGKIVFGKLCTDYNPLTTGGYAVSRTPTLLIFNNSTLIYKHVGNYPQEELESIILTVLHMH